MNPIMPQQHMHASAVSESTKRSKDISSFSRLRLRVKSPHRNRSKSPSSARGGGGFLGLLKKRKNGMERSLSTGLLLAPRKSSSGASSSTCSETFHGYSDDDCDNHNNNHNNHNNNNNNNNNNNCNTETNSAFDIPDLGMPTVGSYNTSTLMSPPPSSVSCSSSSSSSSSRTRRLERRPSRKLLVPRHTLPEMPRPPADSRLVREAFKPIDSPPGTRPSRSQSSSSLLACNRSPSQRKLATTVRTPRPHGHYSPQQPCFKNTKMASTVSPATATRSGRIASPPTFASIKSCPKGHQQPQKHLSGGLVSLSDPATPVDGNDNDLSLGAAERFAQEEQEREMLELALNRSLHDLNCSPAHHPTEEGFLHDHHHVGSPKHQHRATSAFVQEDDRSDTRRPRTTAGSSETRTARRRARATSIASMNASHHSNSSGDDSFHLEEEQGDEAVPAGLPVTPQEEQAMLQLALNRSLSSCCSGEDSSVEDRMLMNLPSEPKRGGRRRPPRSAELVNVLRLEGPTTTEVHHHPAASKPPQQNDDDDDQSEASLDAIPGLDDVSSSQANNNKQDEDDRLARAEQRLLEMALEQSLHESRHLLSSLDEEEESSSDHDGMDDDAAKHFARAPQGISNTHIPKATARQSTAETKDERLARMEAAMLQEALKQSMALCPNFARFAND